MPRLDALPLPKQFQIVNSDQLAFPTMPPETPEAAIHETLARAMIRYRGNVRAYYSKLLEKVPPPPKSSEFADWRAFASQQQKKRRELTRHLWSRRAISAKIRRERSLSLGEIDEAHVH